MDLNRKTLYWSGLTLYVCVLFVILTLYRLPADRLVAATIDGLSEGKLLLEAQKTSLTFPGSYKMEQVSYGIILGDGPAMDSLESLTVSPHFPKFLLGYFPVKFEGIMPRGAFRGKLGIGIISGLENGYFGVKAFDLELEDLTITKLLSQRELTGKLNGELRLEGNLADFSKLDGEGYLNVDDASIGSRIEVPGLETVTFESIKVAFLFRDGRMILNSGELTGSMFSGEASGDIVLDKKLSLSRLNMEARMIPGPSMTNNPMAGQFFSKIRKGNSPLIIKIRGTLGMPSIHWSTG